MSTKWKEVIALRFVGKRFDDRALDLDAIEELPKFQKLVVKVAKEIWHRQHPERERLPRNFDARLRLSLRDISSGSAVAHLEIPEEQASQEEMFEDRSTIVQHAIELLQSSIMAANQQQLLPEVLPREVIPDLGNWGNFETEDEAIELQVPRKTPVRFDNTCRNRIKSFLTNPYEEVVEIAGEVFEADVKAGRFQVLMPDSTKVTIAFPSEQEQLITSALKDHSTYRLRVKGTGYFDASSALQRVVSVSEMILEPSAQTALSNTGMTSLWDELDAIAGQISEEDWRRVPTDLSENLDKYIYGRKER